MGEPEETLYKLEKRNVGDFPDSRSRARLSDSDGKRLSGGIIAGVSQRRRIEIFFGDYFNEGFRSPSRYVPRGRNRNDPAGGFGSRCADYDFVAGMNFVSGLCRAAVEKNKARVTELLSYGASRAEAADFQKEVQTHFSVMSDES